MAMLMSRLTTAQQVLGAETLFIPDDHPLLHLIGNAQSVQGRVLASSVTPTLTRIKLTINLCDKEANALVSSLMSDCSESLILNGVIDPVILPGA